MCDIIGNMNKHQFPKYITVDPQVRFGKPVIKKTRVPVEVVVGKIAGGMTINKVMQEYDLTREQVLAALQYAADLVSQEEIAFA